MQRHHKYWSRREFLGGLTLAGTAGLIGLTPKRASADPPPETDTIRLIYDLGDYVGCYLPVYIAVQLMRAEGFTNVRLVKDSEGVEPKTMAAGHADMSAMFGPDHIVAIDSGLPVVALMGLHGGCQDLVATERVQAIRDLKGKRIAVSELGIADHLFLSNILSYIGLDPRKDVQWVPSHTPPKMVRLLAENKVDAMLAWPPEVQRLRAKKIGHVILSTAADRPWSEYFCCMVGARREFVQKYPVATKRALRAIVKADQLCTSEPERSARLLVDTRLTGGATYQEMLQILTAVRYGTIWRDYNPEAALVFHALRMHETGLIKATPQKIIAQGTDWRFLNGLKKELKA